MTEPLLEIKNLKVHLFTEEGLVKAVNGLEMSINKGETLGLVGESGCGKSMTALSILKLLPPQARIISGQIILEGKEITSLPEPMMREIRGGMISMIFQDPVTSLNPVFTIGSQICESIKLHQKLSSARAKEKAIEALSLVALPSPKEQLSRYPHQLSGGMNQRVMIAMALSTHPSLLIADEPTTALDVTVQAQILDLLKELQTKLTMSILLITHDLSIIAQHAERVAIMYAGMIVETAKAEAIFDRPFHPYTQGLIDSIPQLNQPRKRLTPIPGSVPDPLSPMIGCSFHPRCSKADKICQQGMPEMKTVELGHEVRCWKI